MTIQINFFFDQYVHLQTGGPQGSRKRPRSMSFEEGLLPIGGAASAKKAKKGKEELEKVMLLMFLVSDNSHRSTHKKSEELFALLSSQKETLEEEVLAKLMYKNIELTRLSSRTRSRKPSNTCWLNMTPKAPSLLWKPSQMNTSTLVLKWERSISLVTMNYLQVKEILQSL